MSWILSAPRGKVYLVGAGPGDPGLLTLRGAECLAQADLVLYDYLVNPAILGHAPPSAELVSLGHPHGGRGMSQEEVHRRMIEAARQGKTRRAAEERRSAPVRPRGRGDRGCCARRG